MEIILLVVRIRNKIISSVLFCRCNICQISTIFLANDIARDGSGRITVNCSNKFVSGSENNSLYIYYKGLSKHLLTFKFDTVRSVLEREKREEDANEFVSAVCWRPVSLLRK